MIHPHSHEGVEEEVLHGHKAPAEEVVDHDLVVVDREQRSEELGGDRHEGEVLDVRVYDEAADRFRSEKSESAGGGVTSSSTAVVSNVRFCDRTKMKVAITMPLVGYNTDELCMVQSFLHVSNSSVRVRQKGGNLAIFTRQTNRSTAVVWLSSSKW